MKFKFYALAFFSVFGVSAFATNEPSGGSGSQVDTHTYAQSKFDIIPHSPEVESLGRYGILPVTLYTGLPQISIPLFEIKTPGISVPFSLQYSYNGCKPNEIATNVGLGWSLSGMGIITRIIKGKFDDYLNSDQRFDYYCTIAPLTVDNPFMTSVGIGTYDTEPDIFVFNVGKYAGKFIILKGQVYDCSCPNVKITASLINNVVQGFNIIDDEGNRYDFQNNTETTYSHNIATTLGVTKYISAWYIDRAISANKQDTINFSYQSYTINHPGTLIDVYKYTNNMGGGNNPYSNENLGIENNTGIIITGLLLTNVSSRYSSASFTSSTARLDVQGTNANMLNKISYQINGSLTTNDMIFNYSYFTNNARLKLNSINFIPIGKTYSFGYEDSNFPSAMSMSIDLYGYYNGAGNSNLFTPGYFIPNSIYTPAIRTANSSYGKLGIINQITYPTGGYSTFTWEQNQVQSIGSSVLKDGPGLRVSQIITYDNQTTKPLTIEKYYYYNGDASLMKDAINTSTLSTASGGCGIYPFVSSTAYYASSMSPLSDFINNLFFYARVVKSTQNEQLSGKSEYLFESSTSDLIVNMTSQTDYKYSGGSFIPVMNKTFKYNYIDKNVWNCFGVIKAYTLGTPPNAFGASQFTSPDFADMNCINDIYLQNPDRSANYVIAREYPLLKRETETLYQDSQNGVTTSSDYYYDNPEHTYPTRIAQINSYGDTINTQLKYPLDYNWDNLYTPNAINENYKLEITNLINSFYNCRSNLYNDLADSSLNTGYCCISGDSKKVNSYKILVNKYNCKSNFVTTSNAIYSEKASSLSNYLTNLNNSITGSKPAWQKAILWMRRENVLSPVIEKYVSIKKKDDNNEYLISALRNNYSILNDNGVVKISVDAADFTGNLLKTTFITNPENYYKTKFNFTYSNKFQLTSQTGPDLIPTSYLWGYQGMYPIAEVVNSTYDIVSNALVGSTPDQLSNAVSPDMNVVNNLRYNSTLSGALITTFTYKPLIGLQTATDPRGIVKTYNYDDSGRLITIYNNDNNVLQNYNYHYFTIYYNTGISQTFTKNDCAACTNASQYVYTIAAGKYSSIISQGDADQQAQNELNAQGQVTANIQGTCTVTCSGVNNRCINGTCETGYKMYIASYPTPGGYAGQYTCVWVYEFSDGSQSAQFTEIVKGAPCVVEPPQ